MVESLSLRTDGNRVCIGGRLAISDFRRIIAALHSLTSDRGYQDIILDFGGCTFTHAPPMISLICECARYRRIGVDFSLELPNEYSLNKLFLNSNWANLIEPEKYPTSAYNVVKHNPAKQFTTSDEQGALINQVMDTLLGNFTGFERSHLKAIEWSLNEITDNVLVHSQSASGGVIQVTALKNRRKVEFVVGDSGIGIANSLRMSHPAISSDVDALSRAIQEGVTRDKKLGQGNGLYGTYRLAVHSAGNFSIHSNRATLYFTESAGMHTKSEMIPVNGAVVICGIDYTNALLLDQALRFNDQPYEPVDRIELKYEMESGGRMTFKVAEETSSVGSRVAGTPVRTKLLNLLSVARPTQIVLDFEGVHLISSSFADEVFGKLFVSLGALEFTSKFQFRNIDSTVRKLIDKAIMQRAAVGVSK